MKVTVILQADVPESAVQGLKERLVERPREHEQLHL